MSDEMYQKRLERVFTGLQEVFAPGTEQTLTIGSNPKISTSRLDETITVPADMASFLGTDLSDKENYLSAIDTFSHLTISRAERSWERTLSFVKQHGEDEMSTLVAFVHRMIEEAYITSTRLRRFRGLVPAYAARIDALFRDRSRYPPVGDLPHDFALLEGLRQLAVCGRAHALAEAPRSIRGLLAWIGAQLDEARDTRNPEPRDEIASRVLEAILDELYHPSTAVHYLEEKMELPFQNLETVTPTRVDQDEETSAIEYLLAIPVLPVFGLLLLDERYEFGVEPYVEDFYESLPAPEPLVVYSSTFLLPIFLPWATLRFVCRRAGIWTSIAPLPRRIGQAVSNGVVGPLEKYRADHTETTFLGQRGKRVDVVEVGISVLKQRARKGIGTCSQRLRERGRSMYATMVNHGHHWYRRLSHRDWRAALPDDHRDDEIDVSAYAAPRLNDTDQSPIAPDEQTTAQTEDGETDEEGTPSEGGEPRLGKSKQSGHASSVRPVTVSTAEGEDSTETATPSDSIVADIAGIEETDAVCSDPSIIPDLDSFDKKTRAELDERKAARDERIEDGSDVEEVMQAVRETGLTEEIRRRFAQFPPEEKSRTEAHTGSHLNMAAVSRTAGGQIGDRDDLFYQQRWQKQGTRCVGVALDLSGSIDEFQAKVALATLGEAVRLLDDDFVAAGFTESLDDLKRPLITAPNEPFEPAHLASVSSGGSTPTAAGIQDLRQLMKRSHRDEKLLIMVTDGRPNSTAGVDGTDAMDAACEQLNRTRRDDIDLVGLGVGTVSPTGMATLFGADGYVTIDDDARALGEQLLDIYRQQVTRKSRA